MGNPLTTEDLYGKSESTSDQAAKEKPLVYEETPVIESVPPMPESHDHASSTEYSEAVDALTHRPQLTSPHELPTRTKSIRSEGKGILSGVSLLVFLLLFMVGVWISGAIRQFLPTNNSAIDSTSSPVVPDTAIDSGTAPSPQVDSLASWKSYDIISGITKKPVSGISFTLPPNVLAPVCDSSSCASQGTYLPGGTRFTVAARGSGQSLRDYRGTAISDSNGVTFTSKEVRIAGKNAMEFIGTFTGRTISGYAFTAMRGVMIPLTDSTSVEFNHFVPSGIVADFDSDDALFDTILSNIRIGVDLSQGNKGETPALPSPLPASTADSLTLPPVAPAQASDSSQL